jgi:hypothetical protein
VATEVYYREIAAGVVKTDRVLVWFGTIVIALVAGALIFVCGNMH